MKLLGFLNNRKEQSPAQIIASEWREESKRTLKNLSKKSIQLQQLQKEIGVLFGKLQKLNDEVNQSLETQEDIQMRFNSAMEALQAELRIANDVLVPSLTAATEKIQATYEADVAIQVMRETTLKIPRDSYQE